MERRRSASGIDPGPAQLLHRRRREVPKRGTSLRARRIGRAAPLEDEEVEKLKTNMANPLGKCHRRAAWARFQRGAGQGPESGSERGRAADANLEAGKTCTEAETIVRRRDRGLGTGRNGLIGISRRWPQGRSGISWRFPVRAKPFPPCPMVSAPCRCSITIPVNVVGQSLDVRPVMYCSALVVDSGAFQAHLQHHRPLAQDRA